MHLQTLLQHPQCLWVACSWFPARAVAAPDLLVPALLGYGAMVCIMCLSERMMSLQEWSKELQVGACAKRCSTGMERKQCCSNCNSDLAVHCVMHLLAAALTALQAVYSCWHALGETTAKNMAIKTPQKRHLQAVVAQGQA